MSETRRILVIKLSALGDVVQALGPFAAIRRHHADDHVALLTTRPYAPFMSESRLFDAIEIDERPRGPSLTGWLELRRRLRSAGYARVYDLQTSDRSSFYFRLFWPGPYPEWSGIARGCSHPHRNPARDTLHTLERHADQLRMAGIGNVPAPDLSWAEADISRFGLAETYALLIPGGAAHRPAKRWPIESFSALARRLAARGYQPVLVGTAAEKEALDSIAAGCPDAVNLMGRTDFQDIAVLARAARAAIGNDTGPMHIVAVAGCPTIALYSHESDPALCAQRGRAVQILRKPDLAAVSVDEVAMHIP